MLTESTSEKKQSLKTHRGDRRIRVYDYMPYKNRQSGSIDILWPLYSYNILISGRKTGRENVLEHIVYRMLKVKNSDIEAVTKILCLERDLVEFIVSKLREQGFIGEDNRIKEDAVFPQYTGRFYTPSWQVSVWCLSHSCASSGVPCILHVPACKGNICRSEQVFPGLYRI